MERPTTAVENEFFSQAVPPSAPPPRPATGKKKKKVLVAGAEQEQPKWAGLGDETTPPAPGPVAEGSASAAEGGLRVAAVATRGAGNLRAMAEITPMSESEAEGPPSPPAPPQPPPGAPPQPLPPRSAPNLTASADSHSTEELSSGEEAKGMEEGRRGPLHASVPRSGSLVQRMVEMVATRGSQEPGPASDVARPYPIWLHGPHGDSESSTEQASAAPAPPRTRRRVPTGSASLQGFTKDSLGPATLWWALWGQAQQDGGEGSSEEEGSGSEQLWWEDEGAAGGEGLQGPAPVGEGAADQGTPDVRIAMQGLLRGVVGWTGGNKVLPSPLPTPSPSPAKWDGTPNASGRLQPVAEGQEQGDLANWSAARDLNAANGSSLPPIGQPEGGIMGELPRITSRR